MDNSLVVVVPWLSLSDSAYVHYCRACSSIYCGTIEWFVSVRWAPGKMARLTAVTLFLVQYLVLFKAVVVDHGKRREEKDCSVNNNIYRWSSVYSLSVEDYEESHWEEMQQLTNDSDYGVTWTYMPDGFGIPRVALLTEPPQNSRLTITRGKVNFYLYTKWVGVDFNRGNRNI